MLLVHAERTPGPGDIRRTEPGSVLIADQWVTVHVQVSLSQPAAAFLQQTEQNDGVSASVCHVTVRSPLSPPPLPSLTVCSDWTGLYCTRSGGVASAFELQPVLQYRLRSFKGCRQTQSTATHEQSAHSFIIFLCVCAKTNDMHVIPPRCVGSYTLLWILAWNERLWMHHGARCSMQCSSQMGGPVNLTAHFIWGTGNLKPSSLHTCAAAVKNSLSPSLDEGLCCQPVAFPGAGFNDSSH